MLKQVLEIYELRDDASINGQTVSEYLKSKGAEQIEVKTISGYYPLRKRHLLYQPYLTTVMRNHTRREHDCTNNTHRS